MRKGEFVETDDDTIARFYEILCKKARASGYRHYEISNFAIPGMHSRHNRAYWDGTPYLGLGPGAHSLDADGLRRYVASDTKRYVANPGTMPARRFRDRNREGKRYYLHSPAHFRRAAIVPHPGEVSSRIEGQCIAAIAKRPINRMP